MMKKIFYKVLEKETPKIICVGKNYLSHIKEMGEKTAPKSPILFLKPHTSLTHSKTPKIALKNEIEHEIELGLIIKKKGKNIKKKKWKDYIGGYFLALDITDRTLQNEAKKNSQPWALAKGKDDYLPIGNFIEADQILDPQNLEIFLYKNEIRVQKGWTGDMIWAIPDLLEFVSRDVTLVEGDVLLTGTPEGVGRIREGDCLRGFLKCGGQVVSESYWEF